MRRLGILLAVAGLVAGACGDKVDSDAGPNASAMVHLKSPAVGTVVHGDKVTLQVSASGVQIVKADGDTSGRTAHYHVFIDRTPVRPGSVVPVAPDIVHTAASPIVLTGLTTGHHQIFVVLGDGTHHRLGRSVVHTSVHVKDGAKPAKAETPEAPAEH